ncbi:MAG: urease accessory protein UreD [Chitinophagaceae bacterium]
MIAKLHIQTNCANGKTSLGQTYFTPPFKVANITEDKRSPWLHLMIMNSSPGVLDGDDYEIKIDLNENSFLQLHTQSYQRLFTMKNGATQSTEIHLQKGSSLIYLPHPCSPHENSSFIAKNRIYLDDQCNLIWGEVLTCGRKLNGEIFQFSKYHTITEIFLKNKLIIKENLLIQPSLVDPKKMGQLEGFTHQASLICIKGSAVVNECLDEVYDFLSQQTDILFGVTTTAGDGMMIRILGHGAEQLHQHLASVSFLIQQHKSSQPVTTIHAS